MKKTVAMILAIVLILSISGCIIKKDTYMFQNSDKSWHIEIPNEFVKDSEEADEQQKMFTVRFKTENGTTFVISEMEDEKIEISEELLRKELEEDQYIKVSGYDVIEVKDIGKAYGASVKDNATGTAMLYYRLRYGDKVVSFILYHWGSLTAEQEAKAKEIISTFRGTKK